MTSDTTASTADPKSPTLESHANRLRRGTLTSAFAGLSWLWTAIAIPFLLVEVAPENLVFRVLYVVEVVLLYRKNKDAHRCQTHHDAGRHRHPGQFHCGSCFASSAIDV